jgi:hypothetical protein
MSGRTNTFAGMGGHQSARAETVEWLTPPEVINALGGSDSFDLDPATPLVQPYPTARQRYTRRDNGLLLPWFGRVWLNPPYSNQEIGKWLARLAAHGRGCALIFARTETDNFFRWVWESASAVLFLHGRLNFHRPDGTRSEHNAGAPSVLCAYGTGDAEMLAFAGIDGKFVPLSLPRGLLVTAIAGTWRELLAGFFTGRRGPVAIDEIYRAFAHHPKAARNNHVRAKLRQELQRGGYRRVAQGQWEAA